MPQSSNGVHPYIILLIGYIVGMIVQDEGTSHGKQWFGIAFLGLLTFVLAIASFIEWIDNRRSQ